MTSHTALHPDIIAAVVADYAAGMSAKDIATKHGVGKMTVLRHARRAGCDINPTGAPSDHEPATRARAVAEYHAGDNSTVLAKRYGVSPTTILRWIHADGLPVRGADAARDCPTCGRTTRVKANDDLRAHRVDGMPCAGETTVQHLALPWPRPPLSLNDRSHWAVRHRKAKEVRTAVALLARKLQPVTAHATVTLHYRPRDNRMRDKDNLFATIKPCIDGLRDAGILAEDDHTRVTPQVEIHDAQRGMPGCCWIDVETAS